MTGVTILMRRDDCDRFRKWEPYDETLDAGLYEQVFDGTAPIGLTTDEVCLSIIASACNSYPGENFAGEWMLPFVTAYRAAGCRSISTGDIVILDGERAYTLDRLGFVAIERPEVPA